MPIDTLVQHYRFCCKVLAAGMVMLYTADAADVLLLLRCCSANSKLAVLAMVAGSHVQLNIRTWYKKAFMCTD